MPVLVIAHPVLVLPLTILPLAILFVFRIPIWLCLGFVAFSFFRLHEAFPVLMPLRIPQLLALPTLLVLFWHIGVKKQVLPYWTPGLTAFATFFVIVTLGIPFASNVGMAMEYWTATYIKIGIMTIAIAWLVRKETDFALALRIIVLSGVAVAIVAISNKLAGIGLVEGTRVTIGRDFGSVLGDPNDLSLVLTFPLSFAISLATTRQRWHIRLFGLVRNRDHRMGGPVHAKPWRPARNPRRIRHHGTSRRQIQTGSGCHWRPGGDHPFCRGRHL